MDKNIGDFYSLVFKMKNIVRWGLMYNTRPENLSEHSFECAVLSHALAIVGNEHFGRNYDTEKILCAGLFHDMNEVLTGDLPTPIKYYNDEIKKSYKDIEKVSEEKMLSLLDEKSAAYYKKILDLSDDEKRVVKAADKLCAYIKCIQEIDRGNKDFEFAKATNEKAIFDFGLPELDYFMKNCIDSFRKNIDEVKL